MPSGWFCISAKACFVLASYAFTLSCRSSLSKLTFLSLDLIRTETTSRTFGGQKSVANGGFVNRRPEWCCLGPTNIGPEFVGRRRPEHSHFLGCIYRQLMYTPDADDRCCGGQYPIVGQPNAGFTGLLRGRIVSSTHLAKLSWRRAGVGAH